MMWLQALLFKLVVERFDSFSSFIFAGSVWLGRIQSSVDF